MKKILKKLISCLITEQSYIKDIFILVIVTRLLFLEDNQLALLAEVIGGLLVIYNNSSEITDN